VTAHNCFWQVERPIVQRIQRSRARALHLSRSLDDLPKRQRRDCETDLWRGFGMRHGIARNFRLRRWGQHLR
jgi:hypothetical protein